jgi:molybdopterin-containing oxidoreductase family membrane subunit
VPTLLGVYEGPDEVVAVARKLRARGYIDLETYSPAPFAEVDDAVIEKPSRVRLYTLVGGLTGVVTGYAMTIWMANDWPLMVGGKPFSSIPPYTIIGFELTILFGGLLTALGLLAVGGLPSLRLDALYGARFSAEEFGVAVRCRDRDVAEIDALLRAHGAREVDLVEP